MHLGTLGQVSLEGQQHSLGKSAATNYSACCNSEHRPYVTDFMIVAPVQKALEAQRTLLMGSGFCTGFLHVKDTYFHWKRLASSNCQILAL